MAPEKCILDNLVACNFLPTNLQFVSEQTLTRFLDDVWRKNNNLITFAPIIQVESSHLVQNILLNVHYCLI